MIVCEHGLLSLNILFVLSCFLFLLECIQVIILKISVTLFLTAPMLISCNCRRAFGPHLPKFMSKPNSVNWTMLVDRLFTFFRMLRFLEPEMSSPVSYIFFVSWSAILQEMNPNPNLHWSEITKSKPVVLAKLTLWADRPLLTDIRRRHWLCAAADLFIICCHRQCFTSLCDRSWLNRH